MHSRNEKIPLKVFILSIWSRCDLDLWPFDLKI